MTTATIALMTLCGGITAMMICIDDDHDDDDNGWRCATDRVSVACDIPLAHNGGMSDG